MIILYFLPRKPIQKSISTSSDNYVEESTFWPNGYSIGLQITHSWVRVSIIKGYFSNKIFCLLFLAWIHTTFESCAACCKRRSIEKYIMLICENVLIVQDISAYKQKHVSFSCIYSLQTTNALEIRIFSLHQNAFFQFNRFSLLYSITIPILSNYFQNSITP